MLIHSIHDHLIYRRSPLTVLVAGAGGNGSKLTVKLGCLSQALIALGHPGLKITLADGDTVSESNLVRQAFYPSDIGLLKATVLINRINLSYGLDWDAMPRYLSAEDICNTRADLLISCVNSRKARATLNEGMTRNGRFIYHLDLGNTRDTGQAVLGCPLGYYNRRKKDRLRTAFELFSELTNVTLREDDTPSCSTIEALSEQDLFVNELVETY